MILQEKIDKLPLSIEYDGRTYNLQMITCKDNIGVGYAYYDDTLLFKVNDDRIKTSYRLEELVDKALTIVENREWEK